MLTAEEKQLLTQLRKKKVDKEERRKEIIAIKEREVEKYQQMYPDEYISYKGVWGYDDRD